MTKQKIILFSLLTLFASVSFGALQWDIAAYLAGGTAVAVTAATMLGAAPIVIGGALAIGVHATVFGLYWNDINPPKTSTGEDASKGISIVLDPNTPLVTPEGWTPPAASPQNQDLNPTPPNTTKPTGKFSITSQFSGDNGYVCNGGTVSYGTFCKLEAATLALLLQKYKTNFELADPERVELNSQFSYDFGGDCLMQDGECTSDTIQPPACPSGYKHVQSDDGGWFKVDKNNVQCTIDDPTKAEKPTDDICEVRVKNGVFKTMPNDPDCQKTVVAGLNTNQISAGTPQKSTYLVASPSNDVTVYDKQFTESTNKTTSTIAHVNPNGVVNSIQTLHSIGNQVGTTPGQTNSSNGNTTDGLTTGGSSGSSSSGGASAGVTAAEVGTILDDKLAKAFDATGSFPNKDDPEDPSNLTEPLVNVLNPVRNIQVPSSAGICPTANFSLLNKTFTMTQHCEILDDYKPTLKNAFSLIYLILAFRIILSA